MKVTFTAAVPLTEPLELWCFTKQPLKSYPDYKLWAVNYRDVPGEVQSGKICTMVKLIRVTVFYILVNFLP